MLDPDQPISISFVTDKTELPRLARHIDVRRLREFVWLQWPNLVIAWIAGSNAHFVPVWRSVPPWCISAVWLAGAIALYVLRTRRTIEASVEYQTRVRAVKINEGVLVVEDDTGETVAIPLKSLFVWRATEGGLPVIGQWHRARAGAGVQGF